MRRCLVILACALIALPTVVRVQNVHSGPPTPLVGLIDAAQITRDNDDIAHIDARNLHDLYFLQGYAHAQDRLFQLDFSRRQASGTLAEILGAALLPTDVQMRTLGLRRAAVASLPALTADTRAALDAYADGVNAWVAENGLPPEYTPLKVTQFEPWTTVDSVVIGKLIALGLSFDLQSDIERTVALLTYQGVGSATHLFDGTKLFFDDLFRSAPFDPASTVPDATEQAAIALAVRRPALTGEAVSRAHRRLGAAVDADTAALARAYLEKVSGLPLLRGYLRRDQRPNSNEWAVAPEHTATGNAMIANDPHLSLGAPPVWYPIHQRAGSFDVIGNTFPGVPFVVLGHNRRIGWGATVNPLDVTDVFQEQVVPDAGSPSGLGILHDGQVEAIIPVPETYRVNVNGALQPVPPGGAVPAATLIVPRRNNGPIVQFDPKTGKALSVAYTGWGATRELDAFRLIDAAGSPGDFRAALQFFDFGSQNFAYADVDGNIAYFTSAEMPVRTDLQAGTVVGLPPFFIRDGTTSWNDWLPVQHPQPNQSLPFEILPADEMPHLVNPPAGWFVNANNDPAGTTLDNDPLNELRPGGGIFYLSPGYDGFRAGRATQLIRAKTGGGARISFADMQSMQADIVMIDAQVFVPYILDAFDAAHSHGAPPPLAALAADARLVEAIGRLRAWDFSTPTGLPVGQGYDAVRTLENDAHSVAATIYAAWRAQFIKSTIDDRLNAVSAMLPAGVGPLPLPDGNEAITGLRHLLDTFDTGHGVGQSGFNFFGVPGVSDPAVARDIVILGSLSNALTALAGPGFAPAFNGSTSQDDYRWGLLHRIVFKHPLGGPYNVPPAGGAFPQPLANLPGIPTDGGFETLDRSDPNPRGATPGDFMFSGGPSNRSVHEGVRGGMRGASSLPGGVSGVLGTPFYVNLLTQWLNNETYEMLQRQNELEQNTMSVEKFVPGR